MSLMLLLMLPPSAFGAKKGAGSKTIRVVLMPVEPSGSEQVDIRQLRSVASNELGALGIFKQVPIRQMQRKLQELEKKRVYRSGCMANPVCIRTVGGVLGARVIFMLKAQSSGSELSLRMQAFDAKSGKIIRRAEEKTNLTGPEVEKIVRWLTRKVSSPMVTTLAKGKGKFEVSCNESDATLLVNGKSFGKRIGKSFKVSSGVFDIMVKKPGFVPYRDVVVIKPGETETISALLSPEQNLFPAVAQTKKTETPVEPVQKPAVAGPIKTEPVQPSPGPRKEPEKEKLPPWMVSDTTKQPFLPVSKPQPSPVPVQPRGEKRFYQTWWFWSLVGVVAVGGGYATYQLLKEDSASNGSAVVVWP